MKTHRVSYLSTLLTLLISGVVVLWASQQAWVITAQVNEWGAADVEQAVGSQIRPLLPVVGAFALASALAFIATRIWGRRVVGGFLLLLAVAGLISVASTLGTPDLQALPVAAAVIGVVVIAAAAGGAVVMAGRWPTLSRRYERTAPPSPWSQLDAGEDPTLSPPPRDWMGP